MTANPPFRYDQVGSLLRPGELKSARANFESGKLDREGLTEIENKCIREVVAKQEQIGLAAVTDGEFRRAWWHFDFLSHLDGVELTRGEKSIQFHGIQTKSENIRVNGKVNFTDHPMVEHFRFLKSSTSVTPKMTIPSPSVLHFRGGRESISTDVYPDLDIFYSDTAEAYKKAVQAFYAAGCRYLQFDDTVWAYLCSEKERQAAIDRGDDPGHLPRIYADMINFALADKPGDMTITTHVCRGNFRSSWIAEGGYEPISDILFNEINYDGYFLEYDTDRAGGFEPLRFLPAGDKRVVLGLITSKFGELEDKDKIKQRIAEAGKFANHEQLCLSPQCGFASTEEGNIISEEQQWAKLKLVIELARETWGDN